MSGVIARAALDFPATGTFRGVGHNSGSYPKYLGRTLYNIFNGHAAPIFAPLANDVEAMLTFLVDDDSRGWYTINVAAQCECATKRFQTKRCTCILAPRRPMDCYDSTLTDQTALGFGGSSFAYVLDPLDNMMHVLAAVTALGRRRIMMLSPEDSPTIKWSVCESVRLSEQEPDWNVLTFGPLEMRLYRHYKDVYTPLFVDLHQAPKQYLRDRAICPNGHSFHEGVGYKPGDRCLGEYPRLVIQGEMSIGCDYVFTLPERVLPGWSNEALTGRHEMASLNAGREDT